jgi:hypothetical protein
MTTAVYIEATSRKAFACALDWPGWCRSAKTEGEALDRLAEYAERYAPVARRAGRSFDAKRVSNFEVVERVAGNPTTEFGAPAMPVHADSAPLTSARATKLVALVEASWATLADVARTSPAALRKGPRGGGRDRDKMVDHVFGAEVEYARKIGLPRVPQPAIGDRTAIAALREPIIERLSHPTGYVVAEKGWLLPYAARRIAWHALDHAWEMEDRRA